MKPTQMNVKFKGYRAPTVHSMRKAHYYIGGPDITLLVTVDVAIAMSIATATVVTIQL